MYFFLVKKLSAFVFTAALFMSACNASHNDKHQHNDKAVPPNTETKVDKSLQLNNGKKWKANPETIEGIHNMQTIVFNGLKENVSPKNMVTPLLTSFQTIFDKCTMTGEAHEQLHHFLLPVKNKLDRMISGDADSLALQELRLHLNTFTNYFE